MPKAPTIALFWEKKTSVTQQGSGLAGAQEIRFGFFYGAFRGDCSLTCPENHAETRNQKPTATQRGRAQEHKSTSPRAMRMAVPPVIPPNEN